MIALKLSKAGYGRPQEILGSPLDIVLAMISYENFIPQFEEKFLEMNKHESS